jgi:putative AdoMet-dependent methyltransferase
MGSLLSRRKLFDDWAAGYDESVSRDEEFPFNGYERLLDTICEQAHLRTGQLVLDLGTGTGNLAARLLKSDCTVQATDFSEVMLEQARIKLPDVQFVKADLLHKWPRELSSHFDRIVSSYVLHEFDLETKIRLLRVLAGEHLSPDGWLVVGDISFPTAEIREQASDRWQERWDEDEHYWAADETLAHCREAGLETLYTQVSSCAGVYRFRLSHNC